MFFQLRHMSGSSGIHSGIPRDLTSLSDPHMMGKGSSAGGGDWDRLPVLRDNPGPVRISRRDLRRMSQEEINLRKSAAGSGEGLPAGELV